MEPIIVKKPIMRFIGLAKNVRLGVAALIRPVDVLKRKAEITNCINEREVFGLFTDPEDYQPETDEFEFFMGVEVSSNENVPEGMVYREVPANTYARFTYQGSIERKGSKVHAYFYSTWLSENSWESAGLYNIEVYDERNKHLFTEGPLKDTHEDIYFPIKQRILG